LFLVNLKQKYEKTFVKLLDYNIFEV